MSQGVTMFTNIIPIVRSEYGDSKPDLLIIIKGGKIRKACISDSANKIELSRILWRMSKELDR